MACKEGYVETNNMKAVETEPSKLHIPFPHSFRNRCRDLGFKKHLPLLEGVLL